MLIYFFVILISLFFGWLASIEKKSNSKYASRDKKAIYVILAILSALPPILVSGFRSKYVGSDTFGTYLEIFNKVLYSGGITGIRDIGYGLLNQVSIFFFGSNYSAILMITSIIISGLAYYSIYRESKNIPLSILLFFTTNVYFVSMNMIRQSISISIFIFSIRYIKDKHFFKYLICILIASSFHSTGLIYLPLYFLFNIVPSIKKIVIPFFIVIVLSPFLSQFIINLLLKSAFFRNYFAWYISSNFNTGNLNIISLIISSLMSIYLLVIYNSAKNDSDYRIMLWCQLLATLSLMLSANIPLMQRVSWLFSFAQFVYLPNTFQYIKTKIGNLVWKYGIIFGYLAYMIATTFIMHYNMVVPYYSIF